MNKRQRKKHLKKIGMWPPVGQFNPYTFVLPMIRRTFPQQIAQQLISVQPMSGSTASAFYFDNWESKGVTVVPYGKAIHEEITDTFFWKVIGEELEDGRIRVYKDDKEYFHDESGEILTEEGFNEKYFVEGL